MNKSRLEAFTDAMVAIAATIMVLELKPPKEISLADLLALWPTLFAYFVSFTLIYLTWYAHHNAFKKAEVITQKAFLLNGVWLFLLTLLPFATGWLGDNLNQTLPEALYVLVQFLFIGSYNVLNLQILKDNPSVANTLPPIKNWGVVFVGGFVLAFIASFFIPIAGIIITAFVNAYSFIPLFRQPLNQK